MSRRISWKRSGSPSSQSSGVLEERERGHVGGRQLVAEEVVAAGEERLEAVERGGDPPSSSAIRAAVRLGLLLLGCDQVRRPLPDLVEPVEEDPQLLAARGVGREERRLRKALLEVLEDARRVVQDEVAVDEDGHELLAADRDDRAPVGRVDVDPLDRARSCGRARARRARRWSRRGSGRARSAGRAPRGAPYPPLRSSALARGRRAGRGAFLLRALLRARSCPARGRARGRGTRPPSATPSGRRTSR